MLNVLPQSQSNAPTSPGLTDRLQSILARLTGLSEELEKSADRIYGSSPKQSSGSTAGLNNQPSHLSLIEAIENTVGACEAEMRRLAHGL